MSMLRTLALTAFVAPAFSMAPAFAGDDPKHPAYDFQPRIIIPAADASASTHNAHHAGDSAAATPVDSRYPAANFIPKVIYLDPALAK